MNLLKNYIEIPERIHQGDFVLKLTEGIAQPQQTLKDYLGASWVVHRKEHGRGLQSGELLDCEGSLSSAVIFRRNGATGFSAYRSHCQAEREHLEHATTATLGPFRSGESAVGRRRFKMGEAEDL